MDKQFRAVVFSGGFCRAEQITPEELRADLTVAADAGRLTAEKCGITPQIVAGDFDSSAFPQDYPAEIVRVPAEKDDTDTMLACDLAIRRGASEILIVGGTGGRIDHTLSNLFLLENLRERGVYAMLCDGENRVRLLQNETCTLHRTHYTYFSLIALGDATVTLTGCRYPLTDAPLRRALPYAVSNEISGETAEITVSGAPVFLIESGDAPSGERPHIL